MGSCGRRGYVRAAAAGKVRSDVVLSGNEADDEQNEDSENTNAAAETTTAGRAPAIFNI